MATLDEFRDTLQHYTDACNGGRNGYTDACNGGRNGYTAVTLFDNARDFNAAARLLHKHASLCASKVFGEERRDGSRSMWMAKNTLKIRIEYAPAKRQQDVRQTSIEAYEILDTAPAQRRILECILRASRNGGDITRAEIAYELDMEKSSVAGRVNELLDICRERPVSIDGTEYRLSESGTRHSRCPGAAASKVAALRLTEYKRENSPASAVQTNLFTA